MIISFINRSPAQNNRSFDGLWAERPSLTVRRFGTTVHRSRQPLTEKTLCGGSVRGILFL